MPGFLRRKTTPARKASLPDTTLAEKLSSRAPPSLPPLILSLSLSDPDPNTRVPVLPPAALPPVLAPAPDYPLEDAWDPWKAYPAAPRVDHHAVPPQPARNAAQTPSDAPNICNSAVSSPSRVATAPSPRKMSTHQVQALPPPKCDALGNQSLSQKPPSSLGRPSSPPPVVRGQTAPASTFDFEESLSAANVTSVVNQFRSYRPPVRHLTSPAPPSEQPQMDTQHPPSSIPHRHPTLPQKPGSSSSLSSSSHHTDATRRTDGSYGSATSASSVPKVIDVSADQGRLDPLGSPLDNSSIVAANALSRPRGPSVDRNPSSTPRLFTTSNARVHRPPTAPAPSVPPSSYSERVRTLARQTSQPSLSASQPPMLFDLLRSGNQAACPLRKGPLIFAAMSATPPPTSLVSKTPVASPTDGYIRNPYPTPPAEYASVEASPTRRKGSVSSILRRTSQIDARPQEESEGPSLTHKLSKSSLVRGGDASSEHFRPRVLTKTRPVTPQKPNASLTSKSLPEQGDPLLLDDDPFARTEGVRMLKPRASTRSRTSSSSSLSGKDDGCSSEQGHFPPLPKVPHFSNDASVPANSPPTPVTPDDYKTARQQRRGQWLEKAPPPAIAEVVTRQLSMEQENEQAEEPPREPTPAPTYFPIMAFMADTNLLPLLLSYLSYSEWLALYSANKQVRELFQRRMLREFVLERFLGTVGYSKWNYEWAEPLALSLTDLHNYLRGVAMPAHEYARLSAAYLQPKTEDAPSTSHTPDILALALTTRAYTRVVLRLRAQADSEARYIKTLQSAESNHARNVSHPGTRQPSVSSRTPSPTSSYSHPGHHHSRGKNERSASFSSSVCKFKSPLYRPGRAPVLRVFVPSPEGEWLSDAGVVECEAELKRSGVLKLLRVGDVVWDVAVGDEGNLGRLLWDGSYLVDLDYRYSRVGELSPYFHSLAFSPSYFHRVIRIGGSASHNPHCNPLVYIDVSPWGREIATNLQLLQDRARTETPHGALHDVVRWVHRSTFTVRPLGSSSSKGQSHARLRSLRVPIPCVDGLYIDPGWYGTVVLEAEGTNEGLVDLQARCGPGVFPPRAESLATKIRNEKEKENRRVWRILREKSRPGEIWLRAVQVKERMM